MNRLVLVHEVYRIMSGKYIFGTDSRRRLLKSSFLPDYLRKKRGYFALSVQRINCNDCFYYFRYISPMGMLFHVAP